MQLTYATKEAVAQRLQFAELGAPLNVPTVIDVDATAALAGPLRDRVGRGSRYLAARLAMVRQGIQDGQIAPTKVPGVGHRADGFTKPLTGAAFREFAAANLGLDTSDLIPTGQGRGGPPRQSAGGVGRNAASNGRPSATPAEAAPIPGGAPPAAEAARASAAAAPVPGGATPGTAEARAAVAVPGAAMPGATAGHALALGKPAMPGATAGHALALGKPAPDATGPTVANTKDRWDR